MKPGQNPELGPYDEDPELPLSYAPPPRELVAADPETSEQDPPPVPTLEEAHAILLGLGWSTGEADTMLADVRETETADEWRRVVWLAGGAR